VVGEIGVMSVVGGVGVRAVAGQGSVAVVALVHVSSAVRAGGRRVGGRVVAVVAVDGVVVTVAGRDVADQEVVAVALVRGVTNVVVIVVREVHVVAAVVEHELLHFQLQRGVVAGVVVRVVVSVDEVVIRIAYTEGT
jgi:hypothetical protein